MWHEERLLPGGLDVCQSFKERGRRGRAVHTWTPPSQAAARLGCQLSQSPGSLSADRSLPSPGTAMSPRAATPQALLLLLLLLLSGRGRAQPPAVECKHLDSCEKCTEGGAEQNITSCEWMQCEAGNSSCIVRGEAVRESCMTYNATAMCEATKTTTKEPENLTSEVTPSPLTASPEVHPSGFDVSSFIGGMVLVLSAQAIFFFIIKFIKSKDSSYQTLI
ncbi:CD164 sialomucin-like 2 protein isoform X2 [Rhinatrema bivittatum]|uniref:CD164 sialomucin-like 2 protein isoform X2 n=1 Tax=Rhinatrema bivittatum TaxID=194408 RepID=UPI001126DFF1|nr:CD164 sialomucin-like 2 protein isoform X2 [Rhinatrema bivittatum]